MRGNWFISFSPKDKEAIKGPRLGIAIDRTFQILRAALSEKSDYSIRGAYLINVYDFCKHKASLVRCKPKVSIVAVM